MRAAKLVVDVDNRLVWSRRTQPSDQGWATPIPNSLVPVPNRSVYSGVLMRDAPSVQSEFHRVGRLDPPTSGSRVPDNKTQPSSSPGPLPVTGRLPDQFHRIGRPRHPASGSGVPDIKTHPSSSSGHFASSWPFVRTVGSGRLYGHLCQSPLLCLQYSYRAAVPSARCSA